MTPATHSDTITETLSREFEDADGTTPQEPYAHQHRRRYAETLSLLPAPPPGARLLDVGIHPGHLAVLAHDRGYQVSGLTNVDLASPLQRIATARGFEVRKVDIEIEPFPFQDGHFDVVLLCEVLEHLYRSPFKVLGEIFRVLKPGGTLILTTPNLSCVDKIFALARGYSYKTPLSAPLHIAFPGNLSHTHFREYTDRELVYALRWQDRAPYRFLPETLLYSSCWQPSLTEVLSYGRRPGRFLLSLVAWCTSRLVARWRSCLMVRAVKPSQLATVSSDSWTAVEGFHDIERDGETSSTDRCALDAPFRWTRGNAGLVLDNPLRGLASHLLLRAGLLAPGDLPRQTVRFFLDDECCAELPFSPDPEFHNIVLEIPQESRDRASLKVRIQSEPWCPGNFGVDDPRQLGIMLAWDQGLVFQEERAPSPRIEKLGKRLSERPS